MNDPLKNELLSAYLDGELSAAEQAEVERLLAANPEARKLLDELRTLSSVLQALPQAKLAEDLTPAVLREAEKRMLGVSSAKGKARSAPLWPARLMEIIWQHLPGSRAIAWATTAVAIGLLIMLSEKQQAMQHLGKGDRKVVALAPPPAEPALQQEKAEGGKVVPAKPYAPPTIQAAPEALKSDELKSQEPKSADTDRKPTAPGIAAAKGPAPSLSAGKPVTSAAVPQRTLSTEEKALNKLKDSAQPSPLRIGKDVLVVHCELTAAAVKEQAFVKLLKANGIEWLPAADEIGAPADEKVATEKNKDVAPERQRQERLSRGRFAPEPSKGEVELVYVEAPPAQIEETLAALAARPDLFAAISFKPSEHRLVQKAVAVQRLQARAADQAADAAVGGLVERSAASGRNFAGAGGGMGITSRMPESAKSGLPRYPARTEQTAPPKILGQAQRIPLPALAEMEETPGEAAESIAREESHSPPQEKAPVESRPQPAASAEEKAEEKIAKEERQGEQAPPAQPKGDVTAVQRQRVLFVLRFVNGSPPVDTQ